MGVENNEAVIATTWDERAIVKVQAWIDKLSKVQQSLFSIMPSLVNNKHTVFLAPDGSKKGWPEAKQGETLRNEFIELLYTFNYDDGSNLFNFIEVGYGEYGQKVLRGNCKNHYGDSEYAGV